MSTEESNHHGKTSVIRILYVHCAGPFGGSSRSLYEMLRLLPLDNCELNFLCQKGSSNNYFSKLGRVFGVAGLSQFDHGQYSFYKGLRWLVLLRELYYIPHVIVGAIRVKRAVGTVDVIHVNDFVGIIPALLLKLLFKSKMVIHVRSLININKNLIRTKMINFLLKSVADKVVCIDENVRKTIDADIDSEVVHNGLNVGSFEISKDTLRVKADSTLRVGFVGNLLLQKGILDLLAAAVILRSAGRPVEFHIYGDSAKTLSGLMGVALQRAGLRQDVKQLIVKFITDNQLSKMVRLHGFVDDLRSAYENIDVVCFPSHLNAPGRPVIEAAYFGRPAIVSVVDPAPDTLISGVTGLAVPEKDPVSLARAIDVFISNRQSLLVMGVNAKRLSDKFYDQRKNSKRIFEIYQELVGKGVGHGI